MYNVTAELPYESTSDNFMDVGIHENVEMTRVEYGKTEKNEFIAFYFVGADGSKLSHTEWKPTERSTDTPEKLAEKELNQMSRIKQIVLNFIPESSFIFQANSFEDFAKKVIALLGTTFVGVKLRVKVVYSGKYTSLPTYWKFRFIERMDQVPADKSKIKVLSIDKMTRTPDPIPTNTNPFDTAPSLATGTSPF
jgi:hypothetical protein